MQSASPKRGCCSPRQLDLIEFIENYPKCDHVPPNCACLVCGARMLSEYQSLVEKEANERLSADLRRFFASPLPVGLLSASDEKSEEK